MAAINDPTAAYAADASVPVTEVQVDTSKLTALSPEVISKQATVGISARAARVMANRDGHGLGQGQWGPRGMGAGGRNAVGIAVEVEDDGKMLFGTTRSVAPFTDDHEL